MTIYRISKNVNKCYEEYHTCQDCNKIHSSYNDLRHDNTDDGGFCWCGSSDIKVLIHKTIYQELWVEDSLSTDDVLEVALELETWEVVPHTIRIIGEQK